MHGHHHVADLHEVASTALIYWCSERMLLVRLLSFRGLLSVELLLLEVVLVLSFTTTSIHHHGVAAWVPPPPLGIGSLLLPVSTETIRISEASNQRLLVQEVSDFFVDSFWTAKVGGGARQLSSAQRRSLQSQQAAEFTKRYGGRRQSELLALRRRAKRSMPACGSRS